MASRWRRRVLLSAVAAVFACEVEETSTIEVVVRSDPPMRSSSAFPAEVLVGFDSRGAYLVFRVGFLCAPDASFWTTATFTVPGAGGGAVAVDAWLVPVGGGSPRPCGPLQAPQPVPFRGAPAGAPRTSARVEVLGGCGSGDVGSATLVFK